MPFPDSTIRAAADPRRGRHAVASSSAVRELRPDRGPSSRPTGHQVDGALQSSLNVAATIPATGANFEAVARPGPATAALGRVLLQAHPALINN